MPALPARGDSQDPRWGCHLPARHATGTAPCLPRHPAGRKRSWDPVPGQFGKVWEGLGSRDVLAPSENGILFKKSPWHHRLLAAAQVPRGLHGSCEPPGAVGAAARGRDNHPLSHPGLNVPLAAHPAGCHPSAAPCQGPGGVLYPLAGTEDEGEGSAGHPTGCLSLSLLPFALLDVAIGLHDARPLLLHDALPSQRHRCRRGPPAQARSQQEPLAPSLRAQTGQVRGGQREREGTATGQDPWSIFCSSPARWDPPGGAVR